MKKFLRTLALVLTMAIFCSSVAVFATGGNNSNAVENTQRSLSNGNEYVVTQTDLEDATGTTSDGTTTWGLYDSGDPDHGKVYVIRKYKTWSAVSNGNTGVKYYYNSKQYTLFDEPIEPNSYYILSYDHKSFPTVSETEDEPSSTLYDGGRFTLAPSVSTYVTSSGTDWRNFPPASDYKWSTHTTIFYSDQKTALDTKINVCGTYTTSYVDNVKLVKAVKLDVYNPGGTELSLDGTGLMTANRIDGYVAEMGKPLTIKASEESKSHESIVEVIHNGETVNETNGAYYIPAVTGEVKVKFGLKIDEIEKKAGVTIKNNIVYADAGDTYAKFLAKFGMPKDVIEFYNANGEKQNDYLKTMIANPTAKVVYANETLRNYEIKHYGDLVTDGKLTVTDIVALIDGIVLENIEDKTQADVNKSKRVTVSDVVKLRMNILEQNSKPQQFKVLAIGNSFSIDATTYLAQVANAAGFSTDDIFVGNVWYSGCSLEQHMNFTKNGENVHNFYYWKPGASQATIKDTNLKTAIEFTDWDYITIQQASHLSGKYDSFQPYGKELVSYIKEHATNPDVNIAWHMTWAYPQVPPAGYGHHQNFVDYNSDQLTMYNAIVNASTSFASEDERIDLVIPSGTAVQNLRAKVGDIVTRDQFHMNQSYGRLLLSLTWIKKISGKDISVVKGNEAIMDIVNTGVSELAALNVNVTADELIDYLIKSANDAVANPATITE